MDSDRQKQGDAREARFRDGIKKKLQNSEKRSTRTMGRGRASSGRCRPQTLQRFLSLGINSMLPACHSDLRSVPVIRTAFRAGPKQQSCLRGGRWDGGGFERGGGAHKPMRCTFKLTRGCYIFTFLLTQPWLIGEGDGGRGSVVFLDLFFNSLSKCLFPVTTLVQSVFCEGGYFD